MMKDVAIQVFRLVLEAIKDWKEHQVPQLSAAIAFFVMLSLSPLLLTATSVAGIFFEREEAQKQLVAQVDELVGEKGAKVVRQALTNARFKKSSSLLSALFAGGVLLFSASAVFVHLQKALNRIWEARPEDLNMSVIKRVLLVRGTSLAMVLAVGFLLVISLVSSALLSGLENYFSSIWTGLDVVLGVAYSVLSVAMMSGLFCLMFIYLPDKKVDKKAAWWGGFITAVLLTIGKWGIGLYLGNSAVSSAYGAAGSLVALLLWVYYSMLMFFFGAEMTHLMSEQRQELAKASQEKKK